MSETGALTPPIERQVEVEGVPIAVVDHGGDGPPMVLLHGGGRTAADWHMTARRLTDVVRPLAVDFRGHGRSGAVPAWSYEDGIADLAAVIEGLELERPIIAGHSLGGLVVSIYAARHGGCRGVVNVDGHGAGETSQFDGIEPDEVAAALDRFAAESAKGFRSVPNEGDTAWVDAEVDTWRPIAAKAGIPWDDAERLVRRGFRRIDDDRWERSPNADVNVSMYLSLRDLDMMPYYLALTMPTLIFRTYDDGDDPEYDDPEIVRFLEAYNRGLGRQLIRVQAENRKVVVEHFDSGHMIPLERPVELADRLRTFIAGLDR